MMTLFVLCCPFVTSFTPPLSQWKTFITIVQFSSSQNDFEGTIIGDDNEAGQALALEFSRELQARQTRALELRKQQASNRRLLSEEELRFLNNKPFVKRQVTNSAGFFSPQGAGQSVYSVPLDLSPSRGTPRSQDGGLNLMVPISPLFIPTMAVIVALSVYLTFAVSAPNQLEVEDWNTVKDITPIEQVVPPSVYL